MTTSVTNTNLYGSMYADDISQVVTIASASVYYEVPGSLSAGACNGFTFQSSKQLLCTLAGLYKIDFSLSITSATNNERIDGAIMINSTEVHASESAGECINAGKMVCVAGHAIVQLAVNDVVKLCVENDTAAHNITVSHANLTVVRVL